MKPSQVLVCSSARAQSAMVTPPWCCFARPVSTAHAIPSLAQTISPLKNGDLKNGERSVSMSSLVVSPAIVPSASIKFFMCDPPFVALPRTTGLSSLLHPCFRAFTFWYYTIHLWLYHGFLGGAGLLNQN